MAALAADVKCSTVGPVTTVDLVADATDIYYKGSIVYWDYAGGTDATGKVKVTMDAATDRPAGFSPRKQSVSAGDPVEVIVAGVVVVPTGSGVAAVDGGDILCNDGATNSDNPADMKAAGDITPAAGTDCAIGRILKSDGTDMWVQLGAGLTGMVYGTDGWGV